MEQPDGYLLSAATVMSPAYTHPTAIVETGRIGANTKVWAFTHILEGASIGSNCNIGDHCFIESSAVIGDDVTIKNGNSIWDGVTLANGVFVAPGVVFTNDRYPRSPRLPDVVDRYAGRDWLLPTAIGNGATLGAGAIILAGVAVGEFAFVAAGALVVADVPPYALVGGHPASPLGWVCRCGRRLRFEQDDATCAFCAAGFRLQGDSVVPHGT